MACLSCRQESRAEQDSHTREQRQRTDWSRDQHRHVALLLQQMQVELRRLIERTQYAAPAPAVSPCPNSASGADLN